MYWLPLLGVSLIMKCYWYELCLHGHMILNFESRVDFYGSNKFIEPNSLRGDCPRDPSTLETELK